MNSQRQFLICLSIGLFWVVSCQDAIGQFVIHVESFKDTSVYAAGFVGGVPSVTDNNMGEHTHIAVGKANNDRINRGLIGFEFSELISSKAVITKVTFEFDVMQQGGTGGSAPVVFELHPMASDWDEGSGLGNTGIPTGDGATWVMSTALSHWSVPGSDFGDAMGSVFVSGANRYSISTDSLTAWVGDVLIGNQDNLGVLLKANPETVAGSAARVASREAGGNIPPTLVIEFDLDPVLGDVNLDGVANLLDVMVFVQRVFGGTYQPEADCNQDGVVDLLDVSIFVDVLVG